MSFKHLFCAAAAAPLCFAALTGAALAQTNVTTSTTAPLKTSTSGNIDVQTAGTIQPATTETQPAITLDSDGATVTVSGGQVIMRDQTSATAILIQGGAAGRTFGFSLANGLVRADDSPGAVDSDNDTDFDGPFVAGGSAAVRYGVRLTGPGTLTGDIVQSGGLVAVEGNGGSTALSIETGLVGKVDLTGTIGVLGSDAFGVRSTSGITGNVTIGGTLSAIGENTVGVALDGGVTGATRFSGAISTTGFRYPDRPQIQTVLDALDADDLLIGGPAVRLSGAFTGGVRFQTTQADADTNNPDEDGDGITDSLQTASTVVSYGSSPAILIGGAGATTLNNVGTGNFAYGLMLQGGVSAFGVYDAVNSRGIVLGGQGGSVTIDGGVLVSGGVTTSSTFANTTALQFASGASTPVLKVTGSISAGALGDETRIPTARAIQIDAGANLPAIVNTGTIRTGVNGPNANLTSILDSSGTLASITNHAVISAVTATGDVELAPLGEQIALDLRANTAGVSVIQQANPDPAITLAPSITGDILFGSGAALLQVDKGTVAGKVAFGSGADTLTIASGANVIGGLTNTGGLTATVNGTLSMTNAEVVPMTSFTSGTDSTVGFTADQQGTGVGQFQVANTAVLGSGTKFQLGFRSKLDVTTAAPYAPQNLVLIHAAGGLTNNGYDTDLAGDLPYIYAGSLSNTANDLVFTVRRRTAAELGLQGSTAAAFDAFYSVFDKDPTVALQVFGQTTATGFSNLYSQFLPDYSGGPFHAVAEASRALGRVQAEEPAEMNAGPRSWLQEIAFGVDHTSTTGQVVYDAAGFGIAGGVENPGPRNSTVGYAVAFATSDVDNSNRAFGSSLNVSSVMGSLYWRKALRGVVFDVSGTAGYAWFGSTRRVVSTNVAGQQVLARDATARWSGALASARMGASYEARMGKFYVRPEAFVDYVYLYESGFTETGGGQAINLTVGSRASSEAAAQAGITLGARFGRTFHWGPELSVAYRAHLAGEFGSTSAYFTSLPGQPFNLAALAADERRLIIRAALRGTGAYANFALEGSAEMGDVYDEYMGRLVVRFLF